MWCWRAAESVKLGSYLQATWWPGTSHEKQVTWDTEIDCNQQLPLVQEHSAIMWCLPVQYTPFFRDLSKLGE